MYGEGGRPRRDVMDVISLVASVASAGGVWLVEGSVELK